MKAVMRPLRIAWRALFFINATITFLILYPLFFILLSREAWFSYALKLMRFWARLLLWNVGIRYRVAYEQPLPNDTPLIICPNHTSYLDIIMLYIVTPGYFHTVGKMELTRKPLFRLFFNKMNIAVDRESVRSGHKAYTRAGYDIDKNISIAFFPEGKIPQHTPKLAPFKNGPFRLAIEKQIPVVPVTFFNCHEILPATRHILFHCGPGIIHARVHAPIETKGMSMADLESLKQKTYLVIESAMNNYYENR